MRQLVVKHKGVKVKAGDHVRVFVPQTNKHEEGIVAAIDKEALEDGELELLIVSKEDIFGDSYVVNLREWDEEERIFLSKYDKWHWDWVNIFDCELINVLNLEQIIFNLENEIK